jgi:hypothetical protein
MKWHLVLPAAFGLLLSPLAWTADTACLVEGEFSLFGQTIHSKDCMRSAPNDADGDFRSACEALANTSAVLGGAPGKIEYSEECPLPAQGICKGFLGSGRDAYYYARSASDLRELPKSCRLGGGVWQDGGQAAR